MDYLLLASAEAGSADTEAIDAAAAVLDRRGGVEVTRTSTPDELEGALDRLDGRTLVVAGGDGSLHLTVDRLHRRDELGATTMALVPLGTGNDLARGLGLPLDAVEAAEAIVGARSRRLDLVVDEMGGVVVNAVHVGLGAEAAERASGLKGRLGPLAYPVGALIAGVREPGWDLEVSVDGRPLGERPVLMAGIGNGTSIGGGTPLFPRATPDDGLLDVVVVNATGPAARIAYSKALRKGEHLERDDVHHATGREVRIQGEPARHNADGEVSGELATRTYTVVPGAWSLLAPAPA